MGTKYICEILAMDDSGQLNARETSSNKKQAMMIAKEWSKKYYRVEVNSLILDSDNADYVGDELIAAWEDGKKTTK